MMIALPSGQALSVTKTCLVKQGGSSEYFFAVLYFILETLPPKPLTKHYVDILCRHLRKEVSIQHIHSLSKKSSFTQFYFQMLRGAFTLFCRQILPGWQKMAGQVASSSIFINLLLPALPPCPSCLAKHTPRLIWHLPSSSPDPGKGYNEDEGKDEFGENL